MSKLALPSRKKKVRLLSVTSHRAALSKNIQSSATIHEDLMPVAAGELWRASTLARSKAPTAPSRLFAVLKDTAPLLRVCQEAKSSNIEIHPRSS